MIDGEMQAFALTLDKFLDHAAKWRPAVEVVTAVGKGRVERIGYADLRRRSLRISNVLAGLGVRPGDRVATLAWNTQAHVEVWYGVMGMGAVCHTLNPRLTEAQLAAMVGQSQARILIASADLAPLARRVAARTPSLETVLTIDAPVGEDGPAADDLAPMIAAAGEYAVWGGFDETAPCGLCFTSGTTGAPKGVTYTHRSSFLHTLRLLQADVMAITAAETVLAAVPMFHANAWGLPFAAPAAG
ncbi:MAG: AMP-binding protein, partial [Alphaproteobacteria bacterium]|nr:AMP-binding protein [Alphaproteobacteria bacterium]